MALASAYEQAGRQMQQAGLQAADVERQMLGTATGYLQPYTGLGQKSVGAYEQAMFGGPGALTANLEQWPGYGFLQDQMTKRLGAYGAATGSAFSGPAMKGAQAYGGQLGLTYALQPYLSALQYGIGTGARAGEVSGGWTMGAAQNIGQDYMAAAAANAQAQVQAANARAQEGSIWGDLLGAGGFGLGMFMGGPGGGAFGSAIGKGIGSIFNPTPNMAGGGGVPGAGASDMAFPLMDDGGPVTGGQPVVVGGRGPEVFVPEQSGAIVPNHMIPQAGPDPLSNFVAWFGG